jgi:hypothetical protein
MGKQKGRKFDGALEKGKLAFAISTRKELSQHYIQRWHYNPAGKLLICPCSSLSSPFTL